MLQTQAVKMKTLLFLAVLSWAPSVHAGVAIKELLFNKGETLNICFMNGQSVAQNLVKEVAMTWTQYANLNFNFLTNPCSQTPSSQRHNLVRIQLDATGNASNIGRDINYIPFEEATTLLTVRSNMIELPLSLKSNILHEFGHVLGLDHEHFHPQIQKLINNDIIKSCQKIKNWSEEDCRINLLSEWSNDDTLLDSFDPDSIMLYQLSIYGGSLSNLNRKNYLSSKDMEFIKKLYPR